MGFEDICDADLDLGLGYKRKVENRVKSDHQRQKPCFKFDNFFPPSSTSMVTFTTLEPSLKLSLSDERYLPAGIKKVYEDSGEVFRQASPHSALSSFSNASVKRERDLGSEEMDEEKVSSRVSDEDEEGNGRKKLRLSKEQSALLEDSFKEHNTLNPKQKQALAKQLNLRPRQVEVWFQNRRARTKLKQTEVDCEFLKKCCETLTDENRRLHKELQELKALKMAPPPLYMHVPAATLTMCPSCERIGGSGFAGDSSSRPKPHFYNPFTHPSAAC